MFGGLVIGATGFVDHDGYRVAGGLVVLLLGLWFLFRRAT